jgi:8-oxo-dGTP pyrophosphatase MutT (NUDIX family)
VATPLERPSGRVIAVDPDGCVLLFRIEDPLNDKPPIWITPGGGLEPGESPADGAVREFYEETGIVIEVKGEPLEIDNLIGDDTRDELTSRAAPLLDRLVLRRGVALASSRRPTAGQRSSRAPCRLAVVDAG